MPGCQTAARNDERAESIRKCDRHPGTDGRSFAGCKRDCIGRQEVGSRITRMGIHRGRVRHDQHFDAFSHHTRLVQIQRCDDGGLLVRPMKPGRTSNLENLLL